MIIRVGVVLKYKQDFAIHLERRLPFELLLVIQDPVCEELPKVRSRGGGSGGRGGVFLASRP